MRARLKVLIVTDAWTPQINGIVRALQSVGRELTALGHAIRFATAENHRTLPLPTYPEIRLAVFPRSRLIRTINEYEPDAIHIATEGSLGLAARAICLKRCFPFTTSFHTRFPDYVHARFPFIPESAVFGVLKRFHGAACATMVATASLRQELERHGFKNLVPWWRGVDADLFRPGDKDGYCRYGLNLEGPVFLYVGRVAVEKGLADFLSLDLPGSKIVIGEGPSRAELQARFPGTHFLGRKSDNELASYYAASDVFVFPSRTDTFGLVLLEALASGVPVAAYPAPATLNVLGDDARCRAEPGFARRLPPRAHDFSFVMPGICAPALLARLGRAVLGQSRLGRGDRRRCFTAPLPEENSAYISRGSLALASARFGRARAKS
ncbi:MAG TPA: glycosyltransferase family 1 protein [Micropepsaceae bacterium]|nr:glycosyltransferase family 1 protein [Micropepsaceae bacterium]